MFHLRSVSFAISRATTIYARAGTSGGSWWGFEYSSLCKFGFRMPTLSCKCYSRKRPLMISCMQKCNSIMWKLWDAKVWAAFSLPQNLIKMISFTKNKQISKGIYKKTPNFYQKDLADKFTTLLVLMLTHAHTQEPSKYSARHPAPQHPAPGHPTPGHLSSQPSSALQPG